MVVRLTATHITHYRSKHKLGLTVSLYDLFGWGIVDTVKGDTQNTPTSTLAKHSTTWDHVSGAMHVSFTVR